MPAYRPVTRELLMSRMVVAPNGCWEWQGYRARSGYGTLSRNNYPVTVHRAMMELDGPIPKGKVVMHTCDNPPCINPAHLVVADQLANARDMYQKKRDGRSIHPATRYARGSRMGTSKLNEAKVAEIRRRLRTGDGYKKLAKEFEVSRRAVQFIAQGKTWTHVG